MLWVCERALEHRDLTYVNIVIIIVESYIKETTKEGGESRRTKIRLIDNEHITSRDPLNSHISR